MIAGRLQSVGRQCIPSGLRVRVTRDDRGWESGFIPVEEGTFICQCALREYQSNTFRLALYDATGQMIPVLEGEHDNPEQNRHLGTLRISGRQVRRAVSVNAEIHVTLSVDASRHVTARAFIPLVDETIEEVLKNLVARQADPDQLAAELQTIEAQWAAAQQSDRPSSKVATRIDDHLTQAAVELAAAHGGDPGALAKAERHVQELQALLANSNKALELTASLADLTQAQTETRRVVQQYGDPQDHEGLRALEADANRAHERRDPRLCADTTERLWRLYWSVLFRQDGFWVGVFMEQFREVTRQLWSLVPQEAQQDTAKRVSDAGIKR